MNVSSKLYQVTYSVQGLSGPPYVIRVHAPDAQKAEERLRATSTSRPVDVAVKVLPCLVPFTGMTNPSVISLEIDRARWHGLSDVIVQAFGDMRLAREVVVRLDPDGCVRVFSVTDLGQDEVGLAPLEQIDDLAAMSAAVRALFNEVRTLRGTIDAMVETLRSRASRVAAHAAAKPDDEEWGYLAACSSEALKAVCDAADIPVPPLDGEPAEGA